MKKYMIYAAAVVAALSACTKETPLVDNGTEPESINMPVFKATIEGPATKTTLGEGNKVNWENGDEVYIKYQKQNYEQVGYNPYAGGAIYSWISSGPEVYSIYTAAPNPLDPTSATLTFSSFLPGPDFGYNKENTYKFEVVYPASLADREAPAVFVFPETQTYDGDKISFAPMYYSGRENSFAMKNAASILAVTVPASQMASVKSITVSSDEYINGYCEFTEDESGDPVMTIGSVDAEENKSITLVCDASGSNTDIPAEGSKTFYICIPVNHYGYLQIDVTDGTTTKSMRTNKAGGIEIERNKIYPITFAANALGRIHNGHEYVDLGLSVKWATMNVGATALENRGDYFAWGATEPLYEAGFAQENPQAHWKEGKSDGYVYMNTPYQTANTTVDDDTKWTKYLGNIESTFKDPSATDENALKTVLDPEDDAAHVNWGGSWRMPTEKEWTELLASSNCTWTWTTINGVKGYKVQSKKAGFTDNWIFLPVTAWRQGTSLSSREESYYWSSTLSTMTPWEAAVIEMNKSYKLNRNLSRCKGHPIRPVL